MLSPKQEKGLLEKYSKEVLNPMTLEEIPDRDRYFEEITVSSVVEVTAISLRNGEEDNGKKYDIYGTIQLIDRKGATFDLYNRKQDNPETISNGGLLTITPPMDCAITATGLAEVHFDLYDANQDGAPIMDCTFLWDSMMKDCYDEVHEHAQLFDAGQHSSVVIGFITYRHALVCKVNVEFLMDCTGIDVYGEIIARTGKFSTILFDRKQNESVNVKYGTNIPLSRHVVIFPASSVFLYVHLKLFNGVTREKIVEETTQVEIFGNRGFHRYKGPCDVIKQQVRWTHPYLQPHLLSLVAPTSSEIRPFCWNPLLGHNLVEIYSVSIAGHMIEDMDIWGSIDFSVLIGGRICLFNEGKLSPQKLLPYQVVPLKSYTDCLSAPFRMKLELRNGNDRFVGAGWVNWDEQTCIRNPNLMNRHLCSAVRSVTGYCAVVHYSVFHVGIQAIVKIYLNGKNSDMKYFNADGSVSAHYNNYDYSTLYQYEYFRKKLFVGISTDPWLPYPCSSSLISQSSVIVPKGSALMVDVNLKIIYWPTLASIGNDGDSSDGSLQCQDSFEELLEFKYVDLDLSSKYLIFQKEIERSSAQIVIQVEWRPDR